VSFTKWKCGHCRCVWNLPNHAPPRSNQSGARRTPALCKRPQQQGMCAPSPPAFSPLHRVRGRSAIRPKQPLP
jgi:hypothetical protein